MRRIAAAGLLAPLLLAGCGGGSDIAPEPRPDPGQFAVIGHLVLGGGTGAHAVVGLTHDNRCFGVGPNTAFAFNAPVTVQVGDTAPSGRLGPGDIVAPGNGQTMTG